MAGAGQPWYMPLTWPLGHVSTAIRKGEEDKPSKPSSTPYLDLTGNLTAMAAAARYKQSLELLNIRLFCYLGKFQA